MAGERTLYRKIQVILDYAKDKKHPNIESLANYVTKQQPTNFVYYFRDRETDLIKHGYSENSIHQTIAFCINLKFLADREPVVLTKIGIMACNPARFPNILGKQISELLSDRGVEKDAVVAAIRKTLRSETSIPTAQEIWERLGEERDKMGFSEFKRVLNLMGQSKVLTMTQRRIFLP